MADDFDLRALVREVCDTSMVADPTTITKEVAKRIDKHDRAEALEQALPVFVYHAITRARGHVATQFAETTRPTRPTTSRKVAGIRETWRRMLRDQIAVGPSSSDWKFLGQCTCEDLAYAAQVREDNARRNAERAAWLRNLAELLATHGVTTVEELPESVLSEHLGGAT